VIAALRATASFCSTGGGGWDMALALVVGLAALVRRRRR
jgi:MYXO-CTERM domain-containing protein